MSDRRRGVALAHHFRASENLSIKQIADRPGRSPATVKVSFYDPTGEKANAVKARYVRVCQECGAYTMPRNGQGRRLRALQTLPLRCDQATLNRELVVEPMREWQDRYGRLLARRAPRWRSGPEEPH